MEVAYLSNCHCTSGSCERVYNYDNSEELEDVINPSTVDFTIFPISITRLEMKKLLLKEDGQVKMISILI